MTVGVRASDGKVFVSGGGAALVSSDNSDFMARATGPGVVWYHNFDTDAEMNQFRWAGSYGGGNDPQALSADAGYLTRSTNGGPANQPYIQVLRKSASVESNVIWWRPFSALHSPGVMLKFTGTETGRIAPEMSCVWPAVFEAYE